MNYVNNLNYKDFIQTLKKELPMFSGISWTNSIDSTNSYLMRKIKTKKIELPCLKGTNSQFAGKGRQGKSWIDDKCLMFSCAFNIEIKPIYLPLIAIIAGIGACESLRSLVAKDRAEEINLKWPNDIKWNDKKLSGILVESVNNRNKNDNHFLVIGIGINIDGSNYKSQYLHRQIADWTEINSNDICYKQIIDMIVKISKSWHNDISTFSENNIKEFQERFHKIDYLHGKHISVEKKNNIIQSGLASGIDKHGHLNLNTSSGVSSIHFGNISISCKNDYFN